MVVKDFLLNKNIKRHTNLFFMIFNASIFNDCPKENKFPNVMKIAEFSPAFESLTTPLKTTIGL